MELGELKKEAASASKPVVAERGWKYLVTGLQAKSQSLLEQAESR